MPHLRKISPFIARPTLQFTGFSGHPLGEAWKPAWLNVTSFKSNDPLHGVTLEAVLSELVDRYGWEEMGRRVPVRCFLFDPSIGSSLTFLRKTPWARSKVEGLYVKLKSEI
jgi:hypothetical protein